MSRLIALIVASLCVACAPQQNVRPLPDFVDAAIDPGDTVIVTTMSGETIEFVVTEVTRTALHGEDREVRLTEIAELKKVAWKKPPSPCGGEERLGCSVPILVSMASQTHARYREVFYDACEQHDYCYRHGLRTYGLSREYCDSEFHQNMKMTCPRPKDSTLGTILEVFSDDEDSSLICLEVANDFYMAARDYGEKHFRTADSMYCEYDGPP